MIKSELDHFRLLLKYEFGAVIMAIEPDDTIFALLENRDDLVMFVISDENVVVEEDAISIFGNALKIAPKWQYGFEVLFINYWSEQEFAKLIRAWRMKVVHQGIIVFNHYDHKDFPWIKPVVDAEMKDCEQVMQAGNMVAYRIFDKLTADTWKMAHTIPAAQVVQ